MPPHDALKDLNGCLLFFFSASYVSVIG